MDALAPCPFCEADGEWLEAHEQDHETQAIVIWCKYCGAEGPVAQNAADAAERWNFRGAENWEDRP